MTAAAFGAVAHRPSFFDVPKECRAEESDANDIAYGALWLLSFGQTQPRSINMNSEIAPPGKFAWA